MNHNAEAFYAVSTAAAAAAIAVALVSPTNAYAESIAEYTTTFVGTLSRAEVAELMGKTELMGTGSSEWAMQHNQPVVLKTPHTSEQARSEYKAARLEVRAMNAEDSGSAYFQKRAVRVKASTILGGPAR
jgi:hypothetical protein